MGADQAKWTVETDHDRFTIRAPDGHDGQALTVAEVTELIHALIDARSEYTDQRVPCPVRSVEGHDQACAACGGTGFATRAQVMRQMPSAPPSSRQGASS
jgi:hypothetical protein